MRRTLADAIHLVMTMTKGVSIAKATFFIPVNPGVVLVAALDNVMTSTHNHPSPRLATLCSYQRMHQFQSNF